MNIEIYLKGHGITNECKIPYCDVIISYRNDKYHWEELLQVYSELTPYKAELCGLEHALVVINTRDNVGRVDIFCKNTNIVNAFEEGWLVKWIENDKGKNYFELWKKIYALSRHLDITANKDGYTEDQKRMFRGMKNIVKRLSRI